MRNYVQPGDMITLIAVAAIASGAGVLTGSLFGVAAGSAAIGQEVEIKTTGVFDFNADPAATAVAGAKAYWDDTAKQVSATASGNKLIGVFTLDKIATVGFARVRLNGVSI